MYVIFPADEVVYLSYDRLLLFGNSQESSRESKTSSNTPSGHRLSDTSNPSVPSTSTSSTRSFHSVKSGRALSSHSEDLQERLRLRRGDLETLQGSVKSNRSWPQPSTSKVNVAEPIAPIKPQRTKNKRKLLSIEKSPEHPKEAAKTNLKPTDSDRKLSYSEYITVYSGKESKATIESLTEDKKSDGDRSSLISSRAKLARALENEKCQQLAPAKVSRSRAKSKEKEARCVKTNREKASRNLESSSIDRENTPVNIPRAKSECEYLAVDEEPSSSKSFLRGSSPHAKGKELSVNVNARLPLTGQQQLTPEKSPLAKKNFFGSVRGKKTPETTASSKMAGIESPLRDLTHPSYNEALKSHNAVTFKLVRTGLFNYVSITNAHLENTLDVVRQSFFKDELISVSVGLDKAPPAIQDLDEWVMDVIKNGLSLVAIENKTGTVVGCILSKIWVQKEDSEGYFNSFKFKYEESKRFYHINSAIDKQVNFFEVLETDCYIEPMIGAVLPKFRKNNLATELMKVSMQQAQCLKEGRDVRVSLNGELLSPIVLPTALVGICTSTIMKSILENIGYITYKTFELQDSSKMIKVTAMYKYLF